MTKPTGTPIKSGEPTMCSVCAWRQNCNKKFSYAQGSTAKCPDFTRDEFLKPPGAPDKK